MAITSETYLPVVTRVAVIGDHVLRLLFSDGTVGDVDLSAERWTGVREPLNGPDVFALVAVEPESGTVTCGLVFEQAGGWPDLAKKLPSPATTSQP